MLPALVLQVALLGAPAPAPGAVSLRTFAAASSRPTACRPALLGAEHGLWERTRGGVTERYCALLAFGYARLGSTPDAALALAREAEKLQPKLSEPRVLAGRALLRRGDFTGAYAALVGSVQQAGRPLGDVAALRELGVAAQLSSHHAEAAAAYRALVPRVAFTGDAALIRIATLEAASVLALEGPAGLSDAILYLSEAERAPSVPGLDDSVERLVGALPRPRRQLRAGANPGAEPRRGLCVGALRNGARPRTPGANVARERFHQGYGGARVRGARPHAGRR
ncbi:MAG: hypothetical protein QM756_15735 [Polyangiaceae bacterium]